MLAGVPCFAGEAAGMAIGLVMTGSLDSQLLTELINVSTLILLLLVYEIFPSYLNEMSSF